MIDYQGTAREALAALQEAGALVTVAWTVKAPYVPGQAQPAPAEVTIRTYGAMVPYNRERVGTQPDSRIKAGDRNLLLAAISPAGAALVEPPEGAIITAANGEKWKVAQCEAICPTDTTVLFDITARR